MLAPCPRCPYPLHHVRRPASAVRGAFPPGHASRSGLPAPPARSCSTRANHQDPGKGARACASPLREAPRPGYGLDVNLERPPATADCATICVVTDEENAIPDVIEIPIDGVLDLHTFAPRDVADVVGTYLDECQARGILSVRIIHGKGVGVQRRIVEGVLAKHPAVLGFRTAEAWAGGWGATIAELRTVMKQGG